MVQDGYNVFYKVFYKEGKNYLYAYDRTATEVFDVNNVVGIFLQGSQNYGLDYEGSDIDTKCIVLPTLEDLIFNRKPVSTTHVLPNEEHLDLKDVRLYFQTFRKQNLNFMEILFTKYKIVNPTYEYFWDKLVANNEMIARYNPVGAVKTMKGIAMEKKDMAVGFRIEHLQDDINSSQYGKNYDKRYNSRRVS